MTRARLIIPGTANAVHDATPADALSIVRKLVSINADFSGDDPPSVAVLLLAKAVVAVSEGAGPLFGGPRRGEGGEFG